MTTRGYANPDITEDNIAENLCSPTWSTSAIRPPTSYTSPLKLKQMAVYGDTVSDPAGACVLSSANPKCYEEDHLISLENGGHPRDLRNLWPEPYGTQINGQTVGARQKDTVENYIHNAICFNVTGHKSHGTAAHSSMTLKRGQESAAVRQGRIAFSTLRDSQVSHFGLFAKKLSPAARMISATSTGGRGIYEAPEALVLQANIGRASSGLAVAFTCRCDTWI
jgi:hypothetical protein